MKNMMVLLGNPREIIERLESATLSAIGLWWNAQAAADLPSNHRQIKSRKLHFLLPLRP